MIPFPAILRDYATIVFLGRIKVEISFRHIVLNCFAVKLFGVQFFHAIILMQGKELRYLRCVGMMLGVFTFLALTDHRGDSWYGS